jgi:hypothetical protein
MKVWITAFYSDGSQILGNGNGQGTLNRVDYRRTKLYKRIKAGELRARYSHGQPFVHHYEIRDKGGRLIERIDFE